MSEGMDALRTATAHASRELYQPRALACAAALGIDPASLKAYRFQVWIREQLAAFHRSIGNRPEHGGWGLTPTGNICIMCSRTGNMAMADNRTSLQRFLDAHDLTQRDLASGSGLWLSQVNGIIRGHTRPNTETVNKLLAYCRTVDPEITYEALFGAASGAESAA